jgi:TRAP-type transport system periplasmic protein
VQPADLELVKNAVKEISFPAWSEACDKVNPGCAAAWRASVGPIIGMQ